MKTSILHFGLALLMVIGFSACASRVYMSDRGPVSQVRPAPPYGGAVWIGPEYTWQNNRYVYVEPHYVQGRRHHDWVPGYWQKHRGRQVWVSGRWHRR